MNVTDQVQFCKTKVSVEKDLVWQKNLSYNKNTNKAVKRAKNF